MPLWMIWIFQKKVMQQAFRTGTDMCQSLIVFRTATVIAVTDMGLQSVFLKGFRTQPSCIAGHFVRTPGNVGAEIWCIDVM